MTKIITQAIQLGITPNGSLAVLAQSAEFKRLPIKIDNKLDYNYSYITNNYDYRLGTIGYTHTGYVVRVALNDFAYALGFGVAKLLSTTMLSTNQFSTQQNLDATLTSLCSGVENKEKDERATRLRLARVTAYLITKLNQSDDSVIKEAYKQLRNKDHKLLAWALDRLNTNPGLKDRLKALRPNDPLRFQILIANGPTCAPQSITKAN